METDAFFYQLLKQMPQALFELIGLPGDRAKAYRFDSVELKKAFRIDGLFLPKDRRLPLYFVELQNQPLAKFYANLLAKVYCYLEENDPAQDWLAIAIFGRRRYEPKHVEPYRELLQSGRVIRVYLDECPMPLDPPVGLSIVQLLSAPIADARRQVARLMDKVEHEIPDREFTSKVIELVEGLLMRRFPDLKREEVRTMFQLHDIKKSKVWQEAHESGIQVGAEQQREDLIHKWIAEGRAEKLIAELMGMPLKEVRRIARRKQTDA
jgi:predicted transposase/invertase (TIGR01784 family)